MGISRHSLSYNFFFKWVIAYWDFKNSNSEQFLFLFMCHLSGLANMAATSNVRQGARLLAQAVFPLILLPSHVVAEEKPAARP